MVLYELNLGILSQGIYYLNSFSLISVFNNIFAKSILFTLYVFGILYLYWGECCYCICEVIWGLMRGFWACSGFALLCILLTLRNPAYLWDCGMWSENWRNCLCSIDFGGTAGVGGLLGGLRTVVE